MCLAKPITTKKSKMLVVMNRLKKYEKVQPPEDSTHTELLLPDLSSFPTINNWNPEQNTWSMNKPNGRRKIRNNLSWHRKNIWQNVTPFVDENSPQSLSVRKLLYNKFCTWEADNSLRPSVLKTEVVSLRSETRQEYQLLLIPTWIGQTNKARKIKSIKIEKGVNYPCLQMTDLIQKS